MATASTILPVRTWRDGRRFIAFPYSLYRQNKWWVPPLRRDQVRLFHPRKNPFFDHGAIERFIAVDSSNMVVGRIAGIVNGRHRQKYADGVGFFGFFECVENFDVAEALLDTAGQWLRTQDLSIMRGPCNPSINETSGLLVDGFSWAPSIMMPYNPPYYLTYLLQYGFDRVMTMWSYYGAWKHLDLERLSRGASLVKQRMPKLRLRKLDMRRFKDEVKMLNELYNDAFVAGWGHVSMSRAEFMNAARAMRTIINPNLAICIEHDGQPVGFSLTVPNVNQLLQHLRDGRLFPTGFWRLLLRSKFTEISELRTILIGVKKEYQGRGLDALLMHSGIEEARREGYIASEMSWVMDDNIVLKNTLSKLGAVVDKEYALYDIELQKLK